MVSTKKMHRYFRTNDGLGHGEYAYLLKLEEGKYLCCSSIDFYVFGSIITDMEEMDLERVESNEAFKNRCFMHPDLINYLVENL